MTVVPARRRGAVVRTVVVAACVILTAVVVLVAWPKAGVGDLFQFWYAGHVVLAGGSPYDPAEWAAVGTYGELARNVVNNCTPTPLEPTCVWVYPPATAFLFVPFALLDAPAATAVLEAAIALLGVASLVVLARWMRTSTNGLPFMVLFPAFVLTVALAGGANAPARGLILSLSVAMVAVGTWVAIAANQADVAPGLPGAFAPAFAVLLALSCVAAADAERGHEADAGSVAVGRLIRK